MKVTASNVSMWCGILGGLPAIAWYVSAGQDVIKGLRASPNSSWPSIFLGLAVLCFTAMGIANAIAHSKMDALFSRQSDTKSSAAQGPVMTTADPTQFADVDQFYRTYDNALLTEAEQVFRTAINQYRPEDREAILIRTCSTFFWIGTFENNYRDSFGSQLKALRALNETPNGIKLEELRPYYSTGLETVPPQFRNRSFEAWLDWLRNTVLMRQQGEVGFITMRGHEFLKYIIERRYSMDRLG